MSSHFFKASSYRHDAPSFPVPAVILQEALQLLLDLFQAFAGLLLDGAYESLNATLRLFEVIVGNLPPG